ncbi:MAG: hypothetical protein U0Q16_15295 [Bryobacteraceae bacterium]
MSTWTIDDMPESQRPKRNIFRNEAAPAPRAQREEAQAKRAPVEPTRAEQASPKVCDSTAPEPNLSDYIHKSTFHRFRLFIMDALAGFPAARAAVLEAVDRALEEPPPYPEGALG